MEPTVTSYENPLVRSGLALAGANRAAEAGPGDDGILTALEISGMDLRGTELVVLSACDTALGDIEVGEGVFGLRRAFTLAGARILMMSLWPVQDDVTVQQMKDFYTTLGRMPSAEALREAQLATIRELRAREGIADPSLWAPFIVQGAGVLGTGSRSNP
jgi:CHAT domain-containing protein